MIDDVVAEWGGQQCVVRHDPETGAYFVIALHSRRRGPAAGGTRAMQYESLSAAVADAARLASAMTVKMVAARLPMGGGKAVIALPAPRAELSREHWERILDVHAENLLLLQGEYWTGPDVGTDADDMSALYARSGYAFGRPESDGGPGSSADETAHGVYVAIQTAARRAGIDGLADRTVVIQGLGAVGMRVLERVAADGAVIYACDTDVRRTAAADALGARIVDPRVVLDLESDVFVPCAMGGVIDSDRARVIRTSVIAGAANNLLADSGAAEILANRGIVLAPDFIANSGGAIHLVGREVLGWSPEAVGSHVDDIALTLAEVFRRADADGTDPNRAALELAHEQLAS